MSNNNNLSNPFSILADFEGDISTLFNHQHKMEVPILPLRNMMLFPGSVSPISAGRNSSLRLLSKASQSEELIGVMTQKKPETENPRFEDLYPIGVLARVVKTLEMPDGTMTAILQAAGPFRIVGMKSSRSYLKADIEELNEVLPLEGDNEFKALSDSCRDMMARYIQLNESIRDEALFSVRNITNPIFLVNFICTNLPISIEEKNELMQEREIRLRTYKLLHILNRECQYAQLKLNIQNQTREDLDKQQREYFLQQQIRNIQNELGEEELNDAFTLRELAKDKKMPQKVSDLFEREVVKLERMPQQHPDYNVQLTYLQTLVNLPWGEETTDTLDISRAKKILDRDHYGLDKVKERILEFLADLLFRKDKKSPILCLYGPPGVGKTSLGKSIAESMGRKYVRMSLGGVHDEAEIRGHRRTYIGAMPGRIIKGLMKAETDNPVMVLDEIDKVSQQTHNGDPSSALLEVLDPEQNNSFHDNYLDVDYDLSNVMFIATANNISEIPRALLDRMELINVEGYLTEEKKEIARHYLIPKHRDKYQSNISKAVKIPVQSIEYIIEKYTRESGVRSLERLIEKVFRKVAYYEAIDEHKDFSKISTQDVEFLLGKPPYNRDKYQGNDYAGVVTGLAWTSVGGEILFIESSLHRSHHPKLTLTGNLGDVMKESAMIALEYVKSHAEYLNLDFRIFDSWSLHIHVPEGATPKDGPSAGITIATSIASVLTQRKVRKGVAMTGEITLRGKVLPVGGIKEKILAAKRAGITDIVMSNDNRKDIEEINERYLKGLTFHFVENVKEVFEFALLDEKVAHPMNVVACEEKEKKE